MAKTIRDLLLARLGAPTTPFTNRAGSSVGTTAALVLRNDPSRIAFLFVNLSLNTIFLTPVGVPSSTNGIALAASGGSVMVLWEEDGEMTAWEWRAVATAAASTFLALEAILAPESLHVPEGPAG